MLIHTCMFFIVNYNVYNYKVSSTKLKLPCSEFRDDWHQNDNSHFLFVYTCLDCFFALPFIFSLSELSITFFFCQSLLKHCTWLMYIADIWKNKPQGCFSYEKGSQNSWENFHFGFLPYKESRKMALCHILPMPKRDTEAKGYMIFPQRNVEEALFMTVYLSLFEWKYLSF